MSELASPAPPDTSRGFASGMIAGALVIAAVAKPAVGLPVLLLYLVARGGFRIPATERPLALLLFSKLAWLVTIFLAYDRATQHVGSPLYDTSTPFAYFFPTIGIDVILLVFLGLERRTAAFLEGFAGPIFGLLATDLAFNVFSTLTGADPLGRELTTRPDDIIPRVGGVFGHAFQSVNVSLVAVLLAWHFRRRLLMGLGILNVALNGTFRGVLTLLVVAAVYLLLRRRTTFSVLVAALVGIAVAVFGVTVLSVLLSDLERSGNVFRVFAWQNALEVIRQNPWVGFHGFQVGELEGIDFDTIADYGIGESIYLDYGMRFGIFPAAAHLLIMLTILARRTQPGSPAGPEEERRSVTAAVFSGSMFVDSFYGSTLGAVLPATLFGLLCVSTRSSPEAVGPQPTESPTGATETDRHP
jgi:hypothetical protein